MAKKSLPNTHQAAIAAYHTLKDEGLFPPVTQEEVSALEAEFGRYPKSPMSAETALKYAKGLLPLPAISPLVSFTELKGTINQELGIAARGGSEIPAAVWAKMKKDRQQARDERSK